MFTYKQYHQHCHHDPFLKWEKNSKYTLAHKLTWHVNGKELIDNLTKNKAELQTMLKEQEFHEGKNMPNNMPQDAVRKHNVHTKEMMNVTKEYTNKTLLKGNSISNA